MKNEPGDWNQYTQDLFKDLKSTGDALEIQKATISLYDDLQTVGATFERSSTSLIDKAARDFAKEIQSQLETWEGPKFGERPKSLDGLTSGTGPATGTAHPTIDDTAWTKDPTTGEVPVKGGQGKFEIDPEQVKRTQKALAKGLPALATGIRDAVKGFEKGDPFAGSAAVMEICATLASTVGSMTAAGGPPGALIGALFSLVSTVLKAFIKPQKSLLVEIEEVIRNVQAETQQQGLGSAQAAIESVISTVTAEGPRWKFSEIQRMFNATDGTAINTVRNAAEWLDTPTNQDLKLWGTVLAQQCQTYIMAMQILGIASAKVDVSAEADKGANTYAKLAALFTANDAGQLRFLHKIRTAAQARGTMWHIGVFDATGEYPDSGSLFFTDSLSQATRDDWEKLGGEQRAFTVSKTQVQNSADPNPYLAIFGLEKADTQRSVPGPAYRHRKNARTYALLGKWPLKTNTGWKKVEDLEGLTDICATPGDELKTVYLYTADGGQQIKRYTHGQRPVGKGDLKLTLSKTFEVEPDRSVDTVAAVAKPQTVAGDEPEILYREDSVLYGAGHNRFRARYLHAFFSSGIAGEIKAPIALDSTITGVKADSRRLWVFTRGMIFCTTHSSTKDFLHRARQTAPDKLASLPGPKWAAYRIPAELGGAWQTEGRYDGIHELAPCDDGTLWAVFTDKRGNNNMYYSYPNLDDPSVISISGSYKDSGGHDVGTNGWTKIPSMANRIQKQPLFAWSIVEQLTETLEKPTPRAMTAGR